MFRDFLCALTLDIMDTFCGCASQRKLTAKMSFTPAVEKAHSPTQSENRKRKIQPDRNRIRVFNEKRWFAAELSFSRIKAFQFTDELMKKQLNDAIQKINVLREDFGHKTTKAKFFENCNFVGHGLSFDSNEFLWNFI